MNPQDGRLPQWFLAAISASALIVTATLVYQVLWNTEREWVQIDQTGTGEWAKDKHVIPRVFDRRTGDFCEYRGAGAKMDYTSQFARGPWICYPGPTTK